uniref:Uncharacterized protein n=1 Tax=Azospirillum baldaniorum TaxID=1064539 RepID=E5DGE7_9PROT|nr:unknown [Azospirillum baldaniorum]
MDLGPWAETGPVRTISDTIALVLSQSPEVTSATEAQEAPAVTDKSQAEPNSGPIDYSG